MVFLDYDVTTSFSLGGAPSTIIYTIPYRCFITPEVLNFDNTASSSGNYWNGHLAIVNVPGSKAGNTVPRDNLALMKGIDSTAASGLGANETAAITLGSAIVNTGWFLQDFFRPSTGTTGAFTVRFHLYRIPEAP